MAYLGGAHLGHMEPTLPQVGPSWRLHPGFHLGPICRGPVKTHFSPPRNHMGIKSGFYMDLYITHSICTVGMEQVGFIWGPLRAHIKPT